MKTLTHFVNRKTTTLVSGLTDLINYKIHFKEKVQNSRGIETHYYKDADYVTAIRETTQHKSKCN